MAVGTTKPKLEAIAYGEEDIISDPVKIDYLTAYLRPEENYLLELFGVPHFYFTRIRHTGDRDGETDVITVLPFSQMFPTAKKIGYICGGYPRYSVTWSKAWGQKRGMRGQALTRELSNIEKILQSAGIRHYKTSRMVDVPVYFAVSSNGINDMPRLMAQSALLDNRWVKEQMKQVFVSDNEAKDEEINLVHEKNENLETLLAEKRSGGFKNSKSLDQRSFKGKNGKRIFLALAVVGVIALLAFFVFGGSSPVI